MHRTPRRKRSCLWRRSGFWDGRAQRHLSSIIPACIPCTPSACSRKRCAAQPPCRTLGGTKNCVVRHSPRKKLRQARPPIKLRYRHRFVSYVSPASRGEGHRFLRHHTAWSDDNTAAMSSETGLSSWRQRGKQTERPAHCCSDCNSRLR